MYKKKIKKIINKFHWELKMQADEENFSMKVTGRFLMIAASYLMKRKVKKILFEVISNTKNSI